MRNTIRAVFCLCAAATATAALIFAGCSKKTHSSLEYAPIESDGETVAYCVTGIGTEGANVVIPETYNDLPVTSIGESAFEDCTELVSVTIPDSVTAIGNRAFWGCTYLTQLSLGGGVTSIGNQAFYSCTAIKSFNLPASLKSIGSLVFSVCPELEELSVESGNTVYHSQGNCIIETLSGKLIAGCKNSVIPADGSVTSIGSGAFAGCTGLASLSVPDSVTSIGSYAFWKCSQLTSVNVPAGITSIATSVFDACSSLERITLPASITSIGENAFYDCTALSDINIPSNVTSIGDGAFVNCASLESITVPSSVLSIGSYAFNRCTKLSSVVFTNTADWKVLVNSSVSVGKDIPSEELSDAQKAATYLKYTYLDYYWVCGGTVNV